MNNSFFKYRLIIFLAFLAGFLGGWKILFSQKQNSAPPSAPTLTPAIIPTPTETPAEPTIDEEKLIRQILKDYPLAVYLPYEGNDFVINYTGPLSLEITINKAAGGSKEKVLQWFAEKEIDPKTHKIEWK
jgi:hypothetical protein